MRGGETCPQPRAKPQRAGFAKQAASSGPAPDLSGRRLRRKGPTSSSRKSRSHRRAARSYLPSFEIGGAYLGIGQEFMPGASEYDAPRLHDIAAIGKPQRMVSVLLDQQHGHF